MNDNDFKKNIAENLTHYRNLFGMTQAELAEKLSYSDKSVSKWERGEGVPDIFVLKNLADMYGISVDDFFSDTPKKIESPKVQKSRNKILTAFLSAGLVWFVATMVFVILRMILGFLEIYDAHQWIVFIYAIPITAIVILVLSEVWKTRIFSFLSVSLLIWGVALSIHLTSHLFLTQIPDASLVYLIPAVLQVMVILWYILRYFKKDKKTKQ